MANRLPPTLFVLVGLPGAGKTKRARELVATWQGLRLSPDEWMIPLFGESEASGRRDVLEGRFVWLAMQAILIGVTVILDFGCWAKDERSALRHLARNAGANCELVYLAINETEQQRRISGRWTDAPASTFEMGPNDLERFRRQFEVPDEEELSGSKIGPPPSGHETWESWAAHRWPTSIA